MARLFAALIAVVLLASFENLVIKYEKYLYHVTRDHH
jgi:hypothetical protein